MNKSLKDKSKGELVKIITQLKRDRTNLRKYLRETIADNRVLYFRLKKIVDCFQSGTLNKMRVYKFYDNKKGSYKNE